MRPPLNNETDESEVTEVSSQTAASQEPIATATTFTSTLSVKINQLENKKENKEKEKLERFLESLTDSQRTKYSGSFVKQPLDKSKVTDLKSSTEKEEYAKFLEGFTKTRIKKYSEPFVRQPLDQSKVTDLKSSTEEEKFTSFSNSFTDSRRENFLKPIRKSLDKKVKKKDGLQVSSLKQENIGTNELLEKMLIKLKNEPTNAVSYEDKVKIKNILCEVQNFASEKVIEDIKNIIHNNNITRETLSYLNENLGKFMVNKTSKVDDEVLVQGADDGVVD
ncbi:MAG TPA: hypothetical protein LFW20_07220 [Rickettsia endosymbiont of Omalisus fontisbellaquei]|nr:hypothetical protein [Rickettsia endosymbiont of Omalisus fontisbellaquei]